MTPDVKNCAATKCYYNKDERCQAEVVLIGSGHSICNTFVSIGDRHGMRTTGGRVVACHEIDCKFNEELSCRAGSINVDYHEGYADCVTFEPIERIEEDPDVELAEETSEIITEGSTSFRIARQLSE